jgi:hypothetical protein
LFPIEFSQLANWYCCECNIVIPGVEREIERERERDGERDGEMER